MDDSQQQLIPGLAAMSDEALASSFPEQYNRPPLTGSIGDAFTRLHYHESYHNGQIGLLRRIAGKEGAITVRRPVTIAAVALACVSAVFSCAAVWQSPIAGFSVCVRYLCRPCGIRD